MLTGFLALLKLIPGINSLVQTIIGKYYDAKVQIVQAQLHTDEEKAKAYLSALTSVDANRIGWLQAVSQNKWLTAIVVGFSFPFIFYLNKVVVWDICLGLGSTDSIKDQNVIYWGNTVLIGIFGVGGVLAAGHAVKVAVLGSKS